jgi:hypothetical protein
MENENNGFRDNNRFSLLNLELLGALQIFVRIRLAKLTINECRLYKKRG